MQRRRTKPSPESNEPDISLREIGLTLWKDADRDIPILKKAKAEYAMQLRLPPLASDDGSRRTIPWYIAFTGV